MEVTIEYLKTISSAEQLKNAASINDIIKTIEKEIIPFKVQATTYEELYKAIVELRKHWDIFQSAHSEELCYESTKAEYDHCVQRSERLDNKVYILLTVYAFLFVLLCDIIKKIAEFSFPTSFIQLDLIIIYSVLLTLNVGLYVFVLIRLTNLLKGIIIKRFKPLIILEKDMVNADSKAVAKYVCSCYNQCIDTNNDILEKKFKIFNICANCIIPIIIISLFLILISDFYFIIKSSGMKSRGK